MAFTSNITNKQLQFHTSQNELIPGLPYDLALECLIRTPITSHPSLRLVSHLWKSTISNPSFYRFQRSCPSFYRFRRRSNFAENLIFLIQPLSPSLPKPDHNNLVAKATLDNNDGDDGKKEKPSSGDGSSSGSGGSPLLLFNLNMYNVSCHKWAHLSGISTIPTFSQLVILPSVGKLVALGGWDPSTLEPVSRVILIDLVTGLWREGAPMPTARSFFACSAIGPATVYVAGGHDGRKNALRSVEAYDVISDTWRALPPMSEERDECHGLFFFSDNDAKFWVVSGYGTESQGRFRPDGEVFDPEKGVWETVNGLWSYSGTTPKSTAVVTVDGRRRWWHVAGEIREYEWEEREWKGVKMGRIPEWVNGLLSSSSSVCLVDVGDGKIFVMGNGENNSGGDERVLMLERENEDNVKRGINWRWQHVHATSNFLGFPFATSHLCI